MEKEKIKAEELDHTKKIYKCSNCGKLFNWNENSSWYGSIKQMDDNPDKLIYSCSDKCKTITPKE